MKNRNWSFLLIVIFLTTTITALMINIYYRSYQQSITSEKIYNKLSSNIINTLQTLIEEKKNATLTISLTLAQDQILWRAIVDDVDIQKHLHDFSIKLRKETDFKNVWFQLVDKNGSVVSRSWSKHKGDNLFDLRSFDDISKVSTSIDVDKYDLSFKARVPLYDSKSQFIGFLETITHFNSIAKKIEEEGFDPMIIVHKAHSKNLKYPFSKHFIDHYYIANKGVNKKLLEHLKQHNGIESFLDYKSSYIVDEHDYLIVNHTLFDRSNRIMASIVMFRDIHKIDTSSIKSINLVINILTLFSIIALSFVLILLHTKEERVLEQGIERKKYRLFFTLFFSVLTLLFYLLIYISYTKEREEFFKNHNIEIKKDFDIIQDKYKTIANTMYETIINHENVKETLQRAYGTKQDKELARKKLYWLLIDHYNFFKTYDVRQLHFHLKDNESFLRFHRPGKYGDNLTGIRSTVEWVNSNYAPIDGFEEGRIYNGFRYVFPMSYIKNGHKEHLGSVETSFSAHAIAREFAHSHSAKTGFFVDQKVVDKKVFKSEQSNYADSPIKGFYYENSITKQLEYEFKHIDIAKLSSDQLEFAAQEIFKVELFTLASEDENILYSFFPLKNPVSREVVAIIVLQTSTNQLSGLKYHYIIIFSIGIVLILLATIFLYREYISKVQFQYLSLKTKRILDTQKSIIVITNGKKILDVNQTFLDFLGYESLTAFKKRYRCICDCFIEHESYFHLGKVPKEMLWIEYLEHIPTKDQVVLIQDQSAKECSLAISYSDYQDDYYVLTFNDISGTMKEQIMLQKKVIIDPMTQTYNREFFTSNIDRIIQDIHQNGRELGVVFFDIDHFKKINDTFGHNVGDEVLKELVRRVGESIREDDYLIRWGGEEFIVLITTQSINKAHKVAKHLRSTVEHHHFKEVEHITCSFGVTLLKRNEDIYKAIKRSDDALYTSKENGRNQVTLLS